MTVKTILVLQYETESGGFPIRLWFDEHSKLYSVLYGLQLTIGMTYSEACKELGGSIMHLNSA